MTTKIIFYLLIACNIKGVCHAQVYAKRSTPKEVKPVVAHNIEYSAPTNQMGVIIARNISSNKIIWTKQIYQVRYRDKLERDVQDVFIDTLYIKGTSLMIHNENGNTYSIKIK